MLVFNCMFLRLMTNLWMPKLLSTRIYFSCFFLLLVLLNVCLWFLHLFLSHLSMTFLNIHHILTISCKIIFVSFIIIFVLIFQLISAYFYLFQLITHFHLYELIFPLIFTYFSSYLYLFLLLILLTCFIWIRQTL